MSELPSFLDGMAPAPAVKRSVGSLGSEVLTLTACSPAVVEAAVTELTRSFRKVWYDVRRGIAVFMAPSRAHELTSVDAADLTLALCQCLGVAVVHLRSATTGGPPRGAADPDESFFVGDKAEVFLRIQEQEGREAALERMEDVPPDLVIEVEHTHRDEGKRWLYRDLGVVELWELATGRVERTPTIYDLKAGVAPESVAASRIIAGARADCILAALAALRRIGGWGQFMMRVGGGEPLCERLLAAAGIVGRD